LSATGEIGRGVARIREPGSDATRDAIVEYDSPMRLETFPLACLMLLGAVGSASADQAEWVPHDVAEREVALLTRRTEAVFYCAPCDDQSMERRRYTEVRIARANEDLYEVRLDGRVIDAAYVYVEIGGVFRNLALAVGFEVTGVPETLDRTRVPAGPRSGAGGTRPPLDHRRFRIERRAQTLCGPAARQRMSYPAA
jgi:hypothetical protein